jgi:flagellar P-ring protein precursor FlgI
MRPLWKKILLAILLLVFTGQSVLAVSVRIKDIATFQSDADTDLIGYGLVIGLDGTGDGRSTQFTIQSLVNMMERMGVTVDPNQVKVKNVAAVMLTARISST